MDTIRDPRALFSALRIHKFSSIKDLQLELDPPAIITCQRVQPPDVEPTILRLANSTLPSNNLPERRPSLLPSALNASTTLEIVVGKHLGSGLHGSVHEVELLDRGLHETFALPDLVVKVGIPEDSDSDSDTPSTSETIAISREAFYYEEMECLQGVCIARYYGLFHAILPDGHTIPILLLERLGAELTRPQLVDQIHEIEEMYSELWPLGIEHNDIKRLNLLVGPTGPHALSSLPSPLSGRTYSLRIIDFSITLKSNRLLKNLRKGDLSFMERLERAARVHDYDVQIS